MHSFIERQFSSAQAASRQTLSSIGSGDSESNSSDDISQPVKRKERKKHLMTQRIVSALDTYKISDRAEFHVIAAVLSSVGLSINDFVLSRDSIRSARKEERRKIASKVKQNFNVND